VLRKQISIALRCQPPLEDGDAAGASARNCAKDKGLWTMCRAFKPLVVDLLPALGPNMASSLGASDCGDIKEDGTRPDPISPLLAPLQTTGQICHRQLGPPLFRLGSIPQLLPLSLGCPWRYLHVQLLLHKDHQVLPRCCAMVSDHRGEAPLLAFAQLAGAPGAWKVIHVTVDRLLLQDGSHSALIAADPPRDCTI
jgi:hypothetical protein